MIESIMIVAEQCLLHVPFALGAYISICLLKVPDLSIETAYVTGALVGAHTITVLAGAGVPVLLQLIVVCAMSMFAGALVGGTSGILTQYFKFSPILSSLLTFGIFHGIDQMVTARYISLASYPNPLITAYISRHPEFVSLAIIACMSVLFVYYVLRCQLGYTFVVYGDNAQFFDNYGINGRYIFIMGMLISNMFAGLSGYLIAQSNGFAEINMGMGKTLFIITALIIGYAVGSYYKNAHVPIPLLGLCIYFFMQQLLLRAGFNLHYFAMVQALVVLALLSAYRYHHAQSFRNWGV